MQPIPFVVKINTTVITEENVAQNMGIFCYFHKYAQSKELPIGRKFAQSGHPDRVGFR
jgi:hypothetical protein